MKRIILAITLALTACSGSDDIVNEVTPPTVEDNENKPEETVAKDVIAFGAEYKNITEGKTTIRHKTEKVRIVKSLKIYDEFTGFYSEAAYIEKTAAEDNREVKKGEKYWYLDEVRTTNVTVGIANGIITVTPDKDVKSFEGLFPLTFAQDINYTLLLGTTEYKAKTEELHTYALSIDNWYVNEYKYADDYELF